MGSGGRVDFGNTLIIKIELLIQIHVRLDKEVILLGARHLQSLNFLPHSCGYLAVYIKQAVPKTSDEYQSSS